MPATYAAVSAALDRLAAVRPDFAPETVLDLGSGPGYGELGSRRCCGRRWHPSPWWRPVPIFGRLPATWRAEDHQPSNTADIRRGDIAQPSGLPEGPFDLATIAYALTELDLPAAERLVAGLIGRVGRLVIVEPGTPRDHGRLMAVRQAALKAGARILAPCPHPGPCPLPADDWCHTSVRVERSRAHMRLKGGTVPFEDERYAYLILERKVLATGENESGGRILRPPHLSKHEIAFRLCRADGTLGETRIASRDRAAFKAAGKLEWGDFLPEDIRE